MPVPRSRKNRHAIPTNVNPSGTRCVPVTIPDDPEWVAMFYDALARLSNVTRYMPEPEATTVAGRWRQVLYETSQVIGADLDCADVQTCEDDGCIQLSAFHPAISYTPNHPILQPSESGDYAAHVWQPGNLSPAGLTPDTAMINVAAFLGMDIATALSVGLPSFELSFSGTGEIDLTFVSVLQGGAAWVFPDGNPLVGDLVSLQYIDIQELVGVEALLTLLELIGQGDYQVFDVIHTITYDTPGPHTLTAWMLPTVEPSPPFAGIGGALRNMQVCGDIVLNEDVVIAYTLELDGDSLNLKAGETVVSEIDKDTLQSFLDRWVDETGDTMTGDLRILRGQYDHALEIGRTDGDANVAFQPQAGDIISLITLNNTEAFNIQSGGTRWRLSSHHMLTDDGSGATVSPIGATNLHGSSRDPLVVWAKASNRDLIRAHDSNAQLRFMLDRYGVPKAPGYEGWDYSSTSWRQQFALQGLWDTDTDAIRRGAVQLLLTDYAGDRPILTADYDPIYAVQPRVGMFGATGSFPTDTVAAGDGDRLDRLINQLTAYGWVDPEVLGGGDVPPEPETMSAFEKCNAAYYVAEKLAEMIVESFDILAAAGDYTDLFTYLTSWPFNIRFDLVPSIVTQLQAAYAQASGIVADLADVEDLGGDILASDFALSAVLTALDGNPWIVDTITLVKNALTIVWQDNVTDWINIGKYIQSPYCTSSTLACEDRTYDLRWASLQGWALTKGTQSFATGIVNEFEDPYWGIDLEGYLDDCQLNTIEIDVTVVNDYQWLWWHIYTGSPGDWTQRATGSPGTISETRQTVTVDNLAQWGGIDRVRIRFENETGANPGNIIHQVRLIPEE